jgi:vacuolar protein sorting-associated protein 54
MLRDAEHFKTRIGDLDGAGDAGSYIVNLVKEKSVPKAAIPDPAPAATNGKMSSESASESKPEEEKVEGKENTKVESEKV